MKPGPAAIIAQSGVFGNCLLDVLPQYRLFVSKAVTLGDRMDVNECDVLEYLADDPETRVVMMYLEGAADGARLKKTLEAVTRKKPVMVLKSGRTPAGRARPSPSEPQEDKLYEPSSQTGTAGCKPGGAGRDDEAFSLSPAGRNRLGIVTSAGASRVMATDTVSRGCRPPLSEDHHKMMVGAACEREEPSRRRSLRSVHRRTFGASRIRT
jgi:acyl-CoA synthetase (NDP forming)